MRVKTLLKEFENGGRTTHVLTKEKMASIIGIVFQEQFQKQEANILNIINGTLELTMKEVNSLKHRTSELKKSCEFIEEVLESKARKVNGNTNFSKEVVEEIYEYQGDPDYVHQKLTKLEGTSRRVYPVVIAYEWRKLLLTEEKHEKYAKLK